jgi:hypothetical protein
MRKKVFEGRLTPGGCVVTYGGEKLNPRNNVRNHSPDGFEWGYQGSGPAQLALAVLYKAAGQETALELYQEFKRKVIAHIRADTWKLEKDTVLAWVADALIAAAARERESDLFTDEGAKRLMSDLTAPQGRNEDS